MKKSTEKVIKMVRAGTYSNRVRTAVDAPNLVQHEMAGIVDALDEATKKVEGLGETNVLLEVQLRRVHLWIDEAVKALEVYAAGDITLGVSHGTAAQTFLKDHPTADLGLPLEKEPPFKSDYLKEIERADEAGENL